MKELLLTGKFDRELLYNSLETALLFHYDELLKIKNNVKNSLMSRSGSTFFVLNDKIETILEKSDHEIFENLTTINDGISEI